METYNTIFELTYRPRYLIPISWIALIIGVTFIFLRILISDLPNPNVGLVIFCIVLLLVMVRNFISLWAMIGKETLFLNAKGILYSQKLFGIKVAKQIDYEDIKSISLIDVNDAKTRNFYGFFGYSDFKLELKISRKNEYLLGKYITKAEGEKILHEIENIRKSTIAQQRV